MTTFIAPALLHWVRNAAAAVYEAADFGLSILCPCDDDHGGALWTLGEEQ